MQNLETESPLVFITKRGKEIESVFDELAALRISVFHDYPYLYEGTKEYEKEYLKTYAASARSFLFAVFDRKQMVGATTCIPLSDETVEVRRPFEEAGFGVDKVFYLGESILLPKYRGFGLGHKFFEKREAHAKHFGSFEYCCFCSVERGDSHPSKPENYRGNDAFWIKRGYKKEPSLQSFMEWTDVGEDESTAKKMIFWIKKI